MDFDRIERYRMMSSDEVLRTQEKKLRDFVRYQLYPFSPFYRRLFDEHGIDPSSIKSVKDLEKIPLTRKSDIMPSTSNPKRYKDFILQPTPEKIRKHWPRSKLFGLKMKDIVMGDLQEGLNREYYPTFMIATSGTTGNNVPFMYTERDIRQFSNIYASMTEVTRLDLKWVVLNTFPFAPHLAFIFVYFVNLCLPLRMFHTGGGSVTSTIKTLDVITTVDANVLIGIPSYIYHLLRKAQEKGTDLSSVRMVVTAGEKLSVSTRKRITEILEERGATDFRIFDVYGTTEMRDAYPECTPGKSVYHVHPNMHICEIVDPETGKQKKEGESGALAVTNIDGRGSVVCRFLIGDIFEGGIRYGKCPHCGREGPRLVGPIGRIRDYHRNLELTNVKGTLLNLNTFFDIMPTIEGIDEWQVSIEKKNNDPSDLDLIRIKVAPKKGVKKEKLEKEIKDKINDSIEINPVVDAHYSMDELFEEMGGKIKVQRIVDKRPS